LKASYPSADGKWILKFFNNDRDAFMFSGDHTLKVYTYVTCVDNP
jgi:hypothetical protein